jgi:hypothetical protein
MKHRDVILFSVAVGLLVTSCALRGSEYQPEECILASSDPETHAFACGDGNACDVFDSATLLEVDIYCRPAGVGRQGDICEGDDSMCAPGFQCVQRTDGLPKTCVRACVVGSDECSSGACRAVYSTPVYQNFGTEEVGLCLDELPPTGALRLASGSSGHLEVFANGQWGMVCDDEFNDIAAGVACRQLGFQTGNWYPSQMDTGPFWMDDVRCSGRESRLIDCSFAGIGNHNCASTQRRRVDLRPLKDLSQPTKAWP